MLTTVLCLLRQEPVPVGVRRGMNYDVSHAL